MYLIHSVITGATASSTTTDRGSSAVQEGASSDSEVDKGPVEDVVEATVSEPAPTVTLSQKNAAAKAASYLSFAAFSRDGLIEQLEYEKFSHEDAVYGVDKAGTNWNEQAAKKAQSYLDMSSFSRQGLIDQLKYEKFTDEQATYGVDKVGL